VHSKFRIALPTAQVLIAAALITSNIRSPIATGGDTIPNSRVSGIDIQFCWALNAPAAMIAHIQRTVTHDFLSFVAFQATNLPANGASVKLVPSKTFIATQMSTASGVNSTFLSFYKRDIDPTRIANATLYEERAPLAGSIMRSGKRT
jgi:hypothetical protein